MNEFMNGDVLRCVRDHTAEFMFIGGDPNDLDYFYAVEVGTAAVSSVSHCLYTDFELKPKREKRWIAVWENARVYNRHYADKDVLKCYVERECTDEHSTEPQYIQIEVEI